MVSKQNIITHSKSIVIPLIFAAITKTLCDKLIEILSLPYDLNWPFTIFVWLVVFLYLVNKEINPSSSFGEEKSWEEIRNWLIKANLDRYEERLKYLMNNQIGHSTPLILRNNLQQFFTIAVKSIFDFSTENTDDLDTLLKENQRLILLGRPGSGKTVCLLWFAIKLLKEAKVNDESAIPIIIDLASYEKKGDGFRKWIDNQIKQSAGESRLTSKEFNPLKESHKVCLFFDGLDEVGYDYRKSFIEELNIFLEEERAKSIKAIQNPEVVISSRIAEYEELTEEVNNFTLLEIQSLSPSNAKENLHHLNRREGGNQNPASRLLEQIDQNPILSNALDSPFYNQISLALCHQGSNFPDLRNKHNKDDIQETILSAYITNEVDKINSEYSFWGFRDSQVWLEWLAAGIRRNKKRPTFELADLSPSWTTNFFQRIVLFLLKLPYSFASIVLPLLIVILFFVGCLYYVQTNEIETNEIPQNIEGFDLQNHYFLSSVQDRILEFSFELVALISLSYFIFLIYTVFEAIDKISLETGKSAPFAPKSFRNTDSQKIGVFYYDIKKMAFPNKIRSFWTIYSILEVFYKTVVSF